jgi:hypothetical protein
MRVPNANSAARNRHTSPNDMASLHWIDGGIAVVEEFRLLAAGSPNVKTE